MNPAKPAPLQRSFYQRGPVALAKALLGQRLVREIDGVRLSGIIVETEAYLGARDAAAHTYRGRRTQRNASMFLPGGHSYIYFTYGMHHCMNVVAGKLDQPVAVLLRAIEPEEGIEQMFALRTKAKNIHQLCSGPGKLCQAFALDRSLDGHDLTLGKNLWIEGVHSRTLPKSRIGVSARIGVDYAGDWAQKPLRFFLRDNLHVSKP